MTQRQHDNILYAIPWLTEVNKALFTFTVTRHLAEQGVEPTRIGILGGCGALAYALSSGAFGYLADRLGSRRLIAAGSLVAAGNFAMAMYGLELPTLYYLNVLSGISAALIYPPLLAILAAGQGKGDASRSATRPLIRFCLSLNIGFFCGQVGGGTLFEVDPILNFKVGIGVALAILLVIACWRPGRPENAPVDAVRSPPLEEAPPPALQMYFAVAGWLTNFSAAVSMALMNYIFPQLVTFVGISAATHGRMLGMVRVVIVGLYLGLHFTRFWRHRLSPNLVIMATAIAGLGCMAMGQSAWTLTVGLMGAGSQGRPGDVQGGNSAAIWLTVVSYWLTHSGKSMGG